MSCLTDISNSMRFPALRLGSAVTRQEAILLCLRTDLVSELDDTTFELMVRTHLRLSAVEIYEIEPGRFFLRPWHRRSIISPWREELGDAKRIGLRLYKIHSQIRGEMLPWSTCERFVKLVPKVTSDPARLEANCHAQIEVKRKRRGNSWNRTSKIYSWIAANLFVSPDSIKIDDVVRSMKKSMESTLASCTEDDIYRETRLSIQSLFGKKPNRNKTYVHLTIDPCVAAAEIEPELAKARSDAIERALQRLGYAPVTAIPAGLGPAEPGSHE